jgi:hypothetical protein
MAQSAGGISYYFLDFDDNIMFLSTPIIVLNTVTKKEKELSTGEFANVESLLGRPGPWEDYRIFSDTFRNFRDVATSQLPAGTEQRFVADVRAAIASPGDTWKGPSWKFFVYACQQQRPLSIVTARGHSADTMKAGIDVLVKAGLVTRVPNYHTVLAVTNDDTRRALGDVDGSMTVPALKRRAIIETVDLAVKNHPKEPNLRFGMSDDDPKNVSLIVRAMCECKKKYPDKRFFVINTHMHEEVKLEVFPVDSPVVGHPEPDACAPDFLE